MTNKLKFMKDELSISHYLDEECIAFLDSKTRNEAILDLIHRLDKKKKLLNKDQFYQAVQEREKIVSTGIGIGIAIPHAKLAGYQDFFIAIGILKHQGVEWNALDGLPVRFIFLIGGPEQQQTKYLKILSLITQAIKDESRRKQLLKAATAREVLQIFKGI